MSAIHRPRVATLLAAGCLLLPMLGVHLAYAINVGAGDVDSCNPYLAGCVTISHAVRTGPGLPIFRAILIPCAVAMMLIWWLTRDWLRLHDLGGRKADTLAWLGALGGLFLIAYATYVGTWGPVYEFMRNYAIFGYFGLTALAEILLLSVLWPTRQTLLEGKAKRLIAWLYALCFAMLLFGLAYVFRQFYISDAEAQETARSALEWVFALLLHSMFVAIAGLFWHSPLRLTTALQAVKELED